jgi:hypothetical protein
VTKINCFIAEGNQLISEVPGEEVNNNEDDSGPFLRIESVVSLNPEAMVTEDVRSRFILSVIYHEFSKGSLFSGSKHVYKCL